MSSTTALRTKTSSLISITIRSCTGCQCFSCYHRCPPMGPRKESLVFPMAFNGRSLNPGGVRSMRSGATAPRSRETCPESIVLHWFYKVLSITIRFPSSGQAAVLFGRRRKACFYKVSCRIPGFRTGCSPFGPLLGKVLFGCVPAMFYVYVCK